MISGHRRKHASERLGLETLRCEVVEVSRDEAIILIPAGETIEVDGYSFVVPNKRVFGIWGGVYLDTVSRGNTEYETDGNRGYRESSEENRPKDL